MAVVKLPEKDPRFQLLASGQGEPQDAIFIAIRTIEASISSLKAQRARLMKIQKAQIARKLRRLIF